MRSKKNQWKGNNNNFEKKKVAITLVCLCLFYISGCMVDQSQVGVESVEPNDMTASMENYVSRFEEIKARGVLRVGTAITEPFGL